MLKFNINDYIYIQINEEGWNHLKSTVGESYIQHCIKDYATIVNNETWYRLQCWHVFEILPIRSGSRTLFNTNILFDEDHLKEYKTK